MKKSTFFILITLLVAVLYGCSKKTANSTIPFTLDFKRQYTGFKSLPENYTPKEALVDGCLVVVSKNDMNSTSELYGGAEKWDEFLNDVKNNKDAALRYVHFIEGTPYYTDLFYNNGMFRMFNCEKDTKDRPFKYLRKLTGKTIGTKETRTMYVLTDSLELTYDDVTHSILTSSSIDITDTRFKWLGFTIYLDKKDNSSTLYTDEDMLNMINQITESSIHNPLLGISSNPYDYINERKDIYDNLVEGGLRVSDFFIDQLRNLKANGLNEYIMAVVCSEITGIGKDKNNSWSTAQEWLQLYERMDLQ